MPYHQDQVYLLYLLSTLVPAPPAHQTADNHDQEGRHNCECNDQTHDHYHVHVVFLSGDLGVT